MDAEYQQQEQQRKLSLKGSKITPHQQDTKTPRSQTQNPHVSHHPIHNTPKPSTNQQKNYTYTPPTKPHLINPSIPPPETNHIDISTSTLISQPDSTIVSKLFDSRRDSNTSFNDEQTNRTASDADIETDSETINDDILSYYFSDSDSDTRFQTNNNTLRNSVSNSQHPLNQYPGSLNPRSFLGDEKRNDSLSGSEDGYNSSDEHVVKGLQEIDYKKVVSEEKEFANLVRKKMGLKILKVKEDGACLFRAISLQIYGTQNYHSSVREKCMDYLQYHRARYEQFITEDFEHYIARKRADTCFANNIEIQVLSDLFKRRILIFQGSLNPLTIEPSIESSPHPTTGTQTTDPLYLSYHNHNHYNAIINEHSASLYTQSSPSPQSSNSSDKSDPTDILDIIIGAKPVSSVQSPPTNRRVSFNLNANANASKPPCGKFSSDEFYGPEFHGAETSVQKNQHQIATINPRARIQFGRSEESSGESSMDSQEFNDLQQALELSLTDGKLDHHTDHSTSAANETAMTDLQDTNVYFADDEDDEILLRVMEESRKEYIRKLTDKNTEENEGMMQSGNTEGKGKNKQLV